MTQDDRGAALEIGLKNAEVGLEHEGKIASLTEKVKGLRAALEDIEEQLDDLRDTKADKSKAMAVIKAQGWRAFGLITFAYMMALATGVIDALKEGFSQ